MLIGGLFLEKQELLYEGKAKKIYKTSESDVIWVEYLNQATALNGKKKDLIKGKGSLNNQITSLVFRMLTEAGVPNHFIKKLSETEQLIEAMTMFPLEVVLRNVSAGSFSKRFDVKEGTPLANPIIEFYLKDDKLDDPMMNEEHIQLLELATAEEIKKIKKMTLEVNTALQKVFKEIDIQLIDFKLEFGKQADGTILLADEISPDTCRLWDVKTGEHLDKDVYRRDLGNLVPVYQEVFERLLKLESI